MNKINECNLWKKLGEAEKSYTVRVLSFFHYRRNRIGQSWKREEVITWELIRALDILPRQFFLKELLEYIKENKKELAPVIEKLLENPNEVFIVPFPKLNLTGNKKNSASDIGLSYKDTTLWIEAKTVKIKESDLEKQILIQTKALSEINGGLNFGVIALIPGGQKGSATSFYWSDMQKIFERGLSKMEQACKDKTLINGYKIIAEELINRINSRFQ